MKKVMEKLETLKQVTNTGKINFKTIKKTIGISNTRSEHRDINNKK